jgi:hypothetical protein
LHPDLSGEARVRLMGGGCATSAGSEIGLAIGSFGIYPSNKSRRHSFGGARKGPKGLPHQNPIRWDKQEARLGTNKEWRHGELWLCPVLRALMPIDELSHMGKSVMAQTR